MRLLSALLFSLAATGVVAAQDFTPEFYAGVLGGAAPTYGVVGTRSPSDPAIFSAGAFVGVNLHAGSMLYGLEVAGTTDFGKTTGFESYQPNTVAPFPRVLSTSTCNGCTFPTGGVGSTYETFAGPASNEALQFSYIETLARPTIAGRIGMSAGDLRIYGKAGLGLQYQRQTSVNDQRGTTNCRATQVQTRYTGVSGGQSTQQAVAVACLDPTVGTLTTNTRETWTPVVVGGLGAEYDFDPYFVRGEVEMTHVLYGGSTIRAHGGLGVRF